ncbi:MAG: hypothetical protein ACREMO_08995, partial [Gemmatimonadales bacterium]
MHRFTRSIPRPLFAALLLASAACAQTFDATSLGVPATLASPAEGPAQGTRFRLTTHATYAFWGLTRVSSPSLARALASQLVGGKAVAEVKIKVRSRFSDLLFTVLTAGLVVPRSVTFEG